MLPIDRTWLQKAALNQVPEENADPEANYKTLKTLTDYADGLNQQSADHAGADVLPHKDRSVTRAKIGLRAVGIAELDDNSVTPSKIPNASLDASKFVPGALTNDTQNGLRITALKADIETLENYELTNRLRKEKPQISITIDDGYKEDYTHILPLLNSKGMRASTGVVVDWIGRTDTMNIAQIKELQNVHGWEIASHSKTHSTQFPSKTDAELIMELRVSKEILIGYGLDIKNFFVPYGATSERVQEFCRRYYRATRVSGPGNEGSQNYMPVNMQALNSIVIGDSKGTTVFDPKSGFYVDTFDYYKYYIDQCKETNSWLMLILHSQWMVNNNMLSLFEQVLNYINDVGINVVTMNEGLNNFGNIIDTINFKVGADGKIGGKYGIIGKAKDNAVKNDTPIKDIADGYVTINAVTSGFTAGFPSESGGSLITVKQDNYAERSFQLFHPFGKGTGLFFRDFNNESVSNWQRLDHIIIHPDNTLKSNHTLSDIVTGKLNYCWITTGGAVGYPEDTAGFLTAYRLSSNNGSVYEEYKINNSDKIYIRHYSTTTSSWGAWQLKVPTTKSAFNSYTSTTPISSYPYGVSYCDISAAHASANGFPENIGGALETRKILGDGYIHQFYHLYNSTKTYKRVCQNDGTWSAFVLSHN